jgi:hypothetical protein
LPIFGENIGVFLKNQCYDRIFEKTSISLSKKRQFFDKFFGENILKIITSVPVWRGDQPQAIFVRVTAEISMADGIEEMFAL